MKPIGTIIMAVTVMLLFPVIGQAQEKEFELNGYIQVQGGVFVPLTSNLFQDYDSSAFLKIGNDIRVNEDAYACDPVNVPQKPCYPTSHGAKAGKASMLRSTLQLMGEWRPEEHILVHAVVRLVGSLKLDLDQYAQLPIYPDDMDRRQYNIDTVWRKYYNEIDLREFYVDIEATSWLSFRLGRQQVVWGDVNSYRLLDVINPVNNTWHFGPLESFEDTRIPLWIVKAMFEMKDIDHSLELLWVPGLDRDEETVNTPLTFVGAWGLPLSNTPSPFIIDEKVFMYPGNEFKDMRAGLRWRGNISPQSTYSLMYYYTHMVSPPVPLYFDLKPREGGYGYDQSHMEKLYLGYPRQHMAGFSIDYAFQSPIGLVAKLEASVEPDRTYPVRSDLKNTHYDTEFGDGSQRLVFNVKKKPVLNYAVQFIRPTMIRFLNPTQNFLLLLQFSHSVIFDLSEVDKMVLINIPGYNDYPVTTAESFSAVFLMATTYMHGMIAPRFVVAYVHPNSAFISTSVSFRLGRHWRLKVQLTDFFGSNPYKALGLFRDKDEINLSVRYQF